MELKTILVDLTDDEARDARLDAALTLADWSDGNVVGLSATGPLLASSLRGQSSHGVVQ